MKYQPNFSNDVQSLLRLSQTEAIDQNICITEIQVTQSFYEHLSNYLAEHNLYTYFRYGDGGQDKNGDILSYTCNFRMKVFRKSKNPKFYISESGSTKAVNIEKLKHCETNTPTLLELFYDMVKEYRNEIIGVTWFIEPKQ